jgi:hypothetical protein
LQSCFSYTVYRMHLIHSYKHNSYCKAFLTYEVLSKQNRKMQITFLA